jgi:hypothetical protein
MIINWFIPLKINACAIDEIYNELLILWYLSLDQKHKMNISKLNNKFKLSASLMIKNNFNNR